MHTEIKCLGKYSIEEYNFKSIVCLELLLFKWINLVNEDKELTHKYMYVNKYQKKMYMDVCHANNNYFLNCNVI